MNNFFEQYELAPWAKDIGTSVVPHLPSIAGAFGIFIGGWIVAILLRRLTFTALKRTAIDDKLASLLGIEQNNDHRVERGVSKAVYYLIWTLVLIALLDHLGLDLVTTPLVTALGGVAEAIPSLLKAATIAGVGLLLALLAKKITVSVLSKTRLVDRLQSLGDDPTPDADANATTLKIGTGVFYAIIILTCIPVLDALRVGALAAPLSGALLLITAFLPRLVGAVVIFAVGYFLARIARFFITAAVDKSGLDARLRGWGLAQVLGSHTTGSILGTLAFAFILLHFTISAVGRLGIKEISEPLGLVLVNIYDFLPRLLVAALILALGLFLARLTTRIVGSLLAGIGFNTFSSHIGIYTETEDSKAQQEKGKLLLQQSRSGNEEATEAARGLLNEAGSSSTPSGIAGMVTGAAVALLFVQQALVTLHLKSLSEMLSALLQYLPQVFVAVVVLGFGIWIGSWVKRRIDELTANTEDALLSSLGTVARVAILTVSCMVSLQQLGVASQLVTIAFGLLLGALALALALSFGLGGREVATDILRNAYNKRSKH